MPEDLRVFDSPRGQAAVLGAYDRVLARWTAPYTEVTIPTSFGATHVIVSGAASSPPIVFLHALFATATVWYPNVGPLSKSFRTFAVDVVGEPNGSRPSRRVARLDDFVQWLDELLDGLGLQQASLVGNSFGAFLSAYYAMQRQSRVQHLVLIAPAATLHQIVPFYVNMLAPKMLLMMFPRLLALRLLVRRSITWMGNGLPIDPVWGALFYQVFLHGSMTNQVFPRVFSAAELGRIAAPTLLLVGDHERIYRPESAIEVAQRYIPDVRAELIPNAHHIAALSQPAIVNERIELFLRG
jgi:pimeloyl-ACP methyl ester carboxylesterase